MSRAAEHHRARRQIKAELKAALSGEPSGAQGMFPEGVARKNLFPMKTDANFNLNPILATNIQRSDYFRSLSSLGTFQQVVDEIYHKVSDLEPWSKVGGKTPSTAFCLLFKLCTLRPTLKQVQCMLDHKDSPFIRGIALLFVRFTCPPEDLWTWLSPYMLDEEPIGIESGRRRKSIGDLVVMLIDSTKFLGAQMPRLPRAIETDLKVQVLKAKGEKERLADNLRRKHEFVPGVRVKAKFSQDGEWYEAVIEERAQEDGFVLVKYTEYGNKEHVSLGAVKLAEERSRSRGRRSRSRSRSRSRRRRSRSRSRSRRRRSRSRSRSRRRRSRSGSRSRSRERRSRSGSHRRERDRDRSYRETHRSRERDARRSEDSDRRRDRDRDRSYRDRHRDRYSGDRDRDRDRDRDQERSRDRDRDTSRSYRRSGSQGDRRRFLDEENEEELKRKIAAEERRRAENRKVQSSLRNTQNGNHNKATRSTASELEKQVQMEKEQEEGVLDGPTKNTQQLDPETLARRKAELERIKQRYE